MIPIGPLSPRRSNILQLNYQPSYPWENNSCWLDASLQLLFVALSRNFTEFSLLAQTVQPGHPLRDLHNMFEQRLDPRPNESNSTQILKKQRNDLRQKLVEHREATHLTSFEPLMVRRDLDALR